VLKFKRKFRRQRVKRCITVNSPVLTSGYTLQLSSVCLPVMTIITTTIIIMNNKNKFTPYNWQLWKYSNIQYIGKFWALRVTLQSRSAEPTNFLCTATSTSVPDTLSADINNSGTWAYPHSRTSHIDISCYTSSTRTAPH